MKNRYRFTHPPKDLARPSLRFDNFSLVPANLMGNMREYQALSDRQPKGTAVIVLPTTVSPLRRVYTAIARVLRDHGKHVTLSCVTRSPAICRLSLP